MALIINPKFCKGCGICVTFCPKQALDLDNLGKIYLKDEEACVFCGQCELRCPDYAIKVDSSEDDDKNGGRDDKK